MAIRNPIRTGLIASFFMALMPVHQATAGNPDTVRIGGMFIRHSLSDLPVAPVETQAILPRRYDPIPVAIDIDAPPILRERDTPFGLDCTATMTAEPRTGGVIAIDFVAPCYLRSPVTLIHSGLEVTLLTDHIGRISTLIPAMQNPALIEMRLPGQSVAAQMVRLRDFDDYQRIAFQWTGTASVALGSSARRDTGIGVLPAGHRMFEIGSDQGRAAFYVAPRDAHAIRLDVKIQATADNCGSRLPATALDARFGDMVDITRLMIKLPRCDGEMKMRLRNLLPDMKIAHTE